MWYAKSRTTDTQWRHNSKKSEILGRCGRQNLLRSYLWIWDWDLIFGRAVMAISSPGVCSPCAKSNFRSYPGLGKSGINWNSNGDILNDTNFRRSRRQFHHVGAEYNEEAKTARQTAQVPSTNQHSYCITNSTGGKCLLCLPSN